MMSSEARKRLEAIREFGALGSGFNLALRDLEIRGAGNLLGPQQHGALNAVGLDTYGQLLADEIERQKGHAPKGRREEGPVFELAASAFLPAEYMPSEAERINTYKRILSSSSAELLTLKEECVDRCGPLPPPTETLFLLAELRLRARQRGIIHVAQDKDGLSVIFHEKSPPDATTLEKLLGGEMGKVRFLPGPPQGIRFELEDPEQSLEILSKFLKH
jgi:transcription-repair coupling factor (superfamily II helicase)